MLNNFTWKKIVTGALAFTLVAGAALPVLSNQAPVVRAAEAGITPFTDIPAGLYAEKHIYRLSLQQIVKGYENKATGEFTFKYNNTISQEEAVIMAIRFAGLESKLDMNQMVFFQEDFYVKEDYKPYIELAFEEGLLNRVEEYAIASADPETKWGSKAATREWVTKLIINAIGAQQKAQELAEDQSAFADKDEIDSNYLGYVNAAVELGLVKGVTETKFAPKLAINRASFATILSRAQKDYPIEVGGQHYGIVTAMTDTSITVYEKGEETTYSIDSSTGFYSNDSDFAIEKDSFELYTEVAVIEINGQAKFIETQGTTRYIEETIAPVGRVNTSGKIIYIWVDDNPVSIPYDDSVVVHDSTGNILAITDLKEDSNIKIIRDTFRSAPKVISIELITEGAEATTNVTGTFESYVTSNNMITINTDRGLVSKYLTKNPTINIPYVKNARLDNLIAKADTVTLTMNAKDEVIDISVPTTEYKAMYLPSIVNYDGVKELITVLDATGLKAEALFLSDSTRYLINGMLVDRNLIGTDPLKWNGLLLRYVEVDGKKQVVYFDMLTELDATVTTMNYFDEEVELLLPDGTSTILGYNGATVESLTDSEANLLSIKDGTFLKLELDSVKGTVSKFKLYEVHQMAISSVLSEKKEIKFKYENNTYSVLYDEAEFVDANGKKVAFSELKANRNVIVHFAGNRVERVILQ